MNQISIDYSKPLFCYGNLILNLQKQIGLITTRLSFIFISLLYSTNLLVYARLCVPITGRT